MSYPGVGSVGRPPEDHLRLFILQFYCKSILNLLKIVSIVPNYMNDLIHLNTDEVGTSGTLYSVGQLV